MLLCRPRPARGGCGPAGGLFTKRGLDVVETVAQVGNPAANSGTHAYEPASSATETAAAVRSTEAPAYLDLLVRCHEALRLMQCLYECDLLVNAPEKVQELRSAIQDVELYRQQVQPRRPVFVLQPPDRG